MIKKFKSITVVLLIVVTNLNCLPENIVFAKENKVITQQTSENVAFVRAVQSIFGVL